VGPAAHGGGDARRLERAPGRDVGGGGRPFVLHYSTTLIQALVNGLVGVTVFLIVERGPDAVQRRRMSRGTFGRKRY